MLSILTCVWKFIASILYENLYCMNVVHKSIDVLDSMDWERVTNGKKTTLDFHKVLFETKLPLVFDCLEEVTRRKELESIRRWRKPFFECPKQVQSNDCGLFVWKFLECFDGETLCTNIDPVSFFLFLFLFLWQMFCLFSFWHFFLYILFL